MTTPKLQMPELVVGQAGKELTHNQALAVLDQLAQAVVVDKDLTAPPGSPANGSMYIVAAGATGAWSGKSGKLAYWLTTVAAWTFITPADGWSVWVADESKRYELLAGTWTIATGGSGMTNPMTTAADIIVGGASGVPARLAAGTNGFVLTMVAGAVAWAAAGGGMTNPMTAAGDLIIGGASGAPARLAAGTNGYVLTLSAGVPTWAVSASGFANPMTTAGDMIVGGASGAAARLAKGTDGQILTMVSGVQAWSGAPQLAGYSETMETMSTLAIDVSSSNVKKKVLSANSTFTITGATSGRSHSFTLLLEAGSTYTVTWPASFKWLGGVPTLTAKDLITGFSVDGGTQWIVSYAGSYV